MNNKEYVLSVGKYIADRRKDKNLTQADCCKESGISKSTMSDIEKGFRLPSAKDMLLLCNVLNITPNDILSYGSVNYDFTSVKSDEELAKDDLNLLLKTFVSFFRLSKQSKLLVSSQIYRIAEDENGPSYIKDMENLELASNDIIENDQVKKIVLSKVNSDRKVLGLSPLGEHESSSAIKIFLNMILNSRSR